MLGLDKHIIRQQTNSVNTITTLLRRGRNVGMNVIIICLGGELLLFPHFEVILNLSQFPDFLSASENMWKQLFYHHYTDTINTNNTNNTTFQYLQEVPPSSPLWRPTRVEGERPE